MIRTECDNCKTLAEVPAPAGWIGLTEVTKEPSPSFLAAALGSHAGNETQLAGLFCSWRCAGAYATAKALIESAGSGEGPG